MAKYEDIVVMTYEARSDLDDFKFSLIPGMDVLETLKLQEQAMRSHLKVMEAINAAYSK